MSFRNRLTLFFVMIVIIPMVAVGLVLFRLVDESKQGQIDAALAVAVRAAVDDFNRAAEDASALAPEIGADRTLADALRDGDRTRVRRRLGQLSRRTGAVRIELEYRGRTIAVGEKRYAAPSRRALVDADGKPVGTILVSAVEAQELVDRIKAVTNTEVALTADDAPKVSTAGGIPEIVERAPDGRKGDAELGGEQYRFAEPKGGGIVVFGNQEDGSASIRATDEKRLLGALIVFLLLALAFAYLVSRSLQSQIERLLEAVKRVGGGDFSVEVPVEGRDEFSALGSEFNAMAGQLEARLEELSTERARLQDAIRRIGESLGSNLDRAALLELTVQTAVDAVGGACGRATVRDEHGGPLRETARAGDLLPYGRAITDAEATALSRGEVAEVAIDGQHALAYPLEGAGLLSVAKADRPFSDAERQLLGYLARQAAVSVENVELHETVQRQALTDQLTGLSNRRRFEEFTEDEIERFKRGGPDLGVIMLDIDDFKKVNDTWGHGQGDVVLREVAQVLRDSSREIDLPSRLGGEEMAVALPQTDLEGAFRFAERVRTGIEALTVPILDSDTGETMRVTASFGAASLSTTSEPDRETLVNAVDQALYEAKRSGKNKTVRVVPAAAASGTLPLDGTAR